MGDIDLDILSIDAKIKTNFEKEKKILPEYKKRLKELKITLEKGVSLRIRSDLKKNICDLEEKIRKIESEKEKNFYTVDTAKHIADYKRILSTPIKISFMGKCKKNNKEKKKVVNRFLKAAQRYEDVVMTPSEKKIKNICENCKSENLDIVDECIFICIDCGVQKENLVHATSYNDINRVNMSTKYSYDRIVHFKDGINQYQGKQNSTVPQEVYDALEKAFRDHHLLEGKEGDKKEIRFRKIKKKHIFMFLKELKMSKHYENVNLIYYNFTGRKPDDISYLKDKLLTDFELFMETYDELFKDKIERTNFLNTQNVLYHLLCRHRHPCKRDDFAMLKTMDRQIFQDDIIRKCFEHRGWNMNSSF